MNEPFMFYWFSWFYVVIVYFFMDKSKLKDCLLLMSFLTIGLFDKHIVIDPYMSISLAFFVVWFAALFLYVRYNSRIYDLFVTLTMMLLYAALLLWAKAAPIWFVIHPYVFIPVAVYFFSVLLNGHWLKQLVSTMTALSLGHVLYAAVLMQYQLKSDIDAAFFIYLYDTILLISIAYALTFFIRIIKKTRIRKSA